jgi:mannose-6-phosphate isomerase-like protein (cupin superfamily)
MFKLPTIVVVKRTRRGVGVGQAQQLEAWRRERDGLGSRVLLYEGDVSDARLAVTWVDVAPGSGQRALSHAPEHVYVVVRGWGAMWVGGEERLVVEGDVVFIPQHRPRHREHLGRGPHPRLGGHPHGRLEGVLRRGSAEAPDSTRKKDP